MSDNSPISYSEATYRLLASRLEIYMKITPKFVDFTSGGHLLNYLKGISRFALLTEVVPSEDLVIRHVAHAREVINDPFIEMIAPVCESMS